MMTRLFGRRVMFRTTERRISPLPVWSRMTDNTTTTAAGGGVDDVTLLPSGHPLSLRLEGCQCCTSPGPVLRHQVSNRLEGTLCIRHLVLAAGSSVRASQGRRCVKISLLHLTRHYGSSMSCPGWR